MHITICLAASFIFACSALRVAPAQAVPEFQFQFSEKPGPYAVGLKVVEQFDRARQFQVEMMTSAGSPAASGPRPLQTLVWYPAQTASGQAMTLGDYEALIKTETTFGKPVEHSKPQSFVDAYMQGTTGIHTWAVRDGAMKADRFPVVIYAPSLNAPATENIDSANIWRVLGFRGDRQPQHGCNVSFDDHRYPRRKRGGPGHLFSCRFRKHAAGCGYVKSCCDGL